MLDYTILKKKATTMKIVDGIETEYIDLLSPSFNRDYVPLGNIMVVEKPYVARPDLISFVAYGDDQYADVICKVNGISNPFEMNEGDVLIIPFVGFLSQYYEASNTNLEGLIGDNELIKVSSNKFAKKKNERRLPSELTIGETNFVIDKSLGVVYY